MVEGHVLRPGVLRAWKVVTGFAVVGSAFQMIFRTKYGERDHVFTPVSEAPDLMPFILCARPSRAC
jgi:hypothetical protein